MTQHQSMRITTLDPRYTPTIASMPTEGDLEWAIYEPLDPTDIRRPDRKFVVYETGDNTTVAYGEAEPLDLYYSRAADWGDDYIVLVGGAPLTEEFGRAVGADGYCRDAAQAADMGPQVVAARRQLESVDA